MCMQFDSLLIPREGGGGVQDEVIYPFGKFV